MSDPGKKIRQYIREDVTEMLNHYIKKLGENTGINIQISYKMKIEIPATFYTDLENSEFDKKTRFVNWTIHDDEMNKN